MTNLDQKVQELRALAEKATPGEWQNGMDDLEGVVSIGSTDDGNVVCLPPAYCMELSFAKWPDNAAFIAASNPATLTAILDEYDRRGAALKTICTERCDPYQAAHEALSTTPAKEVTTP